MANAVRSRRQCSMTVLVYASIDGDVYVGTRFRE